MKSSLLRDTAVRPTASRSSSANAGRRSGSSGPNDQGAASNRRPVLSGGDAASAAAGASRPASASGAGSRPGTPSTGRSVAGAAPGSAAAAAAAGVGHTYFGYETKYPNPGDVARRTAGDTRAPPRFLDQPLDAKYTNYRGHTRCKFCNAYVPSHEMDSHYESCPLVSMRCELRDTETGEPCHTITRGRHLMEDHQQKCSMRALPCPSKGCGRLVSVQAMAFHLQRCSYDLVECTHCRRAFPRGEVIPHETVCPEAYVRCPLHCGETMRRGDVLCHVQNMAASHKGRVLSEHQQGHLPDEDPKVVIATLVAKIADLQERLDAQAYQRRPSGTRASLASAGGRSSTPPSVGVTPYHAGASTLQQQQQQQQQQQMQRSLSQQQHGDIPTAMEEMLADEVDSHLLHDQQQQQQRQSQSQSQRQQRREEYERQGSLGAAPALLERTNAMMSMPPASRSPSEREIEPQTVAPLPGDRPQQQQQQQHGDPQRGFFRTTSLSSGGGSFAAPSALATSLELPGVSGLLSPFRKLPLRSLMYPARKDYVDTAVVSLQRSVRRCTDVLWPPGSEGGPAEELVTHVATDISSRRTIVGNTVDEFVALTTLLLTLPNPIHDVDGSSELDRHRLQADAESVQAQLDELDREWYESRCSIYERVWLDNSSNKHGTAS